MTSAREISSKRRKERAERLLQATTAKRKQALARIDQAKADVSNARLRWLCKAHFANQWHRSSKQTDVGYLAIRTPLLTIEDNSRYQLEVAVEESRLGTIHLHDQAQLQIEALGNTELIGSVEEIVPASDPNSRSYIVKVGVPNLAGVQLQSGVYGKARFISGQRQTLAIPKTAISQRGQLTGVLCGPIRACAPPFNQDRQAVR